MTNICHNAASYKLIFGDTFKEYPIASKILEAPCIGYIDPPFNMRENMENIYERCFRMIENLDSIIFGENTQIFTFLYF